jgi:biotin synthase-related radical SAM superfamily protein
MEDVRRGKDSPHSWNGRINIVKMVLLLITIYRFNVILIKTPMSYFPDIGK